jgi:hypothetical protein
VIFVCDRCATTRAGLRIMCRPGAGDRRAAGDIAELLAAITALAAGSLAPRRQQDRISGNSCLPPGADDQSRRTRPPRRRVFIWRPAQTRPPDAVSSLRPASNGITRSSRPWMGSVPCVIACTADSARASRLPTGPRTSSGKPHAPWACYSPGDEPVLGACNQFLVVGKVSFERDHLLRQHPARSRDRARSRGRACRRLP